MVPWRPHTSGQGTPASIEEESTTGAERPTGVEPSGTETHSATSEGSHRLAKWNRVEFQVGSQLGVRSASGPRSRGRSSSALGSARTTELTASVSANNSRPVRLPPPHSRVGHAGWRRLRSCLSGRTVLGMPVVGSLAQIERQEWILATNFTPGRLLRWPEPRRRSSGAPPADATS